MVQQTVVRRQKLTRSSRHRRPCLEGVPSSFRCKISVPRCRRPCRCVRRRPCRLRKWSSSNASGATCGVRRSELVDLPNARSRSDSAARGDDDSRSAPLVLVLLVLATFFLWRGDRPPTAGWPGRSRSPPTSWKPWRQPGFVSGATTGSGSGSGSDSGATATATTLASPRAARRAAAAAGPRLMVGLASLDDAEARSGQARVARRGLGTRSGGMRGLPGGRVAVLLLRVAVLRLRAGGPRRHRLPTRAEAFWPGIARALRLGAAGVAL